MDGLGAVCRTYSLHEPVWCRHSYIQRGQTGADIYILHMTGFNVVISGSFANEDIFVVVKCWGEALPCEQAPLYLHSLFCMSCFLP